MPGGRGTIDQVVDIFIEQVDKINEEEKYSQAVRVAMVEKIGEMIANSIEPNYALDSYNGGYEK